MMNYLQLENDVMTTLLHGDGRGLELLREQHRRSRVEDIEESECGAFVNYGFENYDGPRFKHDFQLSDVVIRDKESNIVLGAICFVRSGVLEVLEIFSYSDDLPENSSELTIEYAQEIRPLSVADRAV